MSAWLGGNVVDLRSAISLARSLTLSFLVGGSSAQAYLQHGHAGYAQFVGDGL